MKILLFGKDGQVGWELQRSLAPLGELVALSSNSEDFCGDLGKPEDIRRTVQAVQPTIIVNAAAHTAVDRAESESQAAHAINAAAPAALAEKARRCGALLVHYSTDYVFDGSGSRPWRETDKPAPLNVYGRTKLAGEDAIRASGCRHLIFRTSWVYGARGGNFARTMLRLAGEREALQVVADQLGAPTGADLIADVTAHAIRRMQSGAAAEGLYHLAASGETSWHGYASFVIESARSQGWPIKTSADAIQPVPTADFPAAAPRPLNSRLDTTRLRDTFQLHLPSWQAGVTRMLAELADKRQ